MRNFIVGLPPLEFKDNKDNLNKLEQICQEFGSNILYWYFSPPAQDFGSVYSSRRKLNGSTLKNLNIEIAILESYNQKLQLALNPFEIMKTPENKIKQDLLTLIKLYKNIKSLVIKYELLPLIQSLKLDKSYDLTFSFNNTLTPQNIEEFNLTPFSTIVVGRRYLRDFSFFSLLEEKGKKIELLINNGCHYYCPYHCSLCETGQKKRIEEKGLAFCLAEQSLLPEELKHYPDNFLLKISSRPSTFDYIYKTLKAYSVYSSSEFNLLDLNQWYYFCRLKPLLDNFPLELSSDFLKEVFLAKEKIWQATDRDRDKYKNF